MKATHRLSIRPRGFFIFSCIALFIIFMPHTSIHAHQIDRLSATIAHLGVEHSDAGEASAHEKTEMPNGEVFLSNESRSPASDIEPSLLPSNYVWYAVIVVGLLACISGFILIRKAPRIVKPTKSTKKQRRH